MYDFFLVPIGVTGFQFKKFRLPRDRIVVTLLEKPVFPSEFHKRNLKARLFRMKIKISIRRITHIRMQDFRYVQKLVSSR